MEVRLLTPRATRYGVQEQGQLIEVDDAEGRRMIAAGQAEKPHTQPETTRPAKPAGRKEQ